MKEALTLGLGLGFALLNVLSVMQGKRIDAVGNSNVWYDVLLFLLGGGAFVAQSRLAAGGEVSHVFIMVVDGALVIGTAMFLFVKFRDPTTFAQWMGFALITVGLAFVLLGKGPSGDIPKGSEAQEVETSK